MALHERLVKMYKWMAAHGVDMAVFSDNEARRDPAIRYFSGHPSDALLFLSAAGQSLLVPWDDELARQMGTADAVLPYTRFKLQAEEACAGALEHFGLQSGAHIEFPAATTYPNFVSLVKRFSGYTLLCRKEGGIDEYAAALRSVKDAGEIALLKKAAAITDEHAAAIEAGVRDASLTTERDIALFIEAECRRLGCEGTGFATLAAGPARSFAIHAFPGYTGGGFGGAGLSILDFGVVYNGYTSDITMSFIRGPIESAQEKQIALVMDAYNLVLAVLAGEKPPAKIAALMKDVPLKNDGEKGLSARAVACMVDAFFAEHGWTMPHGLGHGIGLEVHETPILRDRKDNTDRLLPGSVFTVEPGLYAPAGGCRYENDILLTKSGPEILTHSKMVRLPPA